jgi:hypothetical protein
VAIAVEGTSFVAYQNNIDRQATPITLSAPVELDIGHYYVVLVHFGSLGGGTSVPAPSGFTRLTDYGSSTNRMLVAYGRTIDDAGDLSDVASVDIANSISSATRAGAMGFALSGVDLTAPFTDDSAWVATTSTTSGHTFATAPSGDVVMNFFLNTRSAATAHTLTTTVGGGSLVLQKWSFNGSPGTFNEGTGVSSTAQTSTGFGAFIGGTGVSYSPSALNGSTVSIGLTAAVAVTPVGRVHKVQLSTSTVEAVIPVGRVHKVELTTTTAVTPTSKGRAYRVVLSTVNLQPPVVAGPTTALPGQGLAFSASLPGATDWEWEQTAGPEVALQGTSAPTVTLSAPYPEVETAVTLRVRALSGGVWSGWRNVTFVVSRHELFRRNPTTGDLRPLINASAVIAPPDPEPTPGYPWMIPYDELHASPKKIFYHYFPPYPITHSNEAPYASGSYQGDYYTRNFLAINGEGGAHAAYGGLLRDRPMPTGVPFTGSDWMIQQQRVELQSCLESGGDGFFVNIMSSGDTNHWARMNTLADVCADEFPDLSVIPMVDANASFSTQSNAVIASALNTFYNRGSGYMLGDGRRLLGTFKAEGKTLAYWQTLVSTLGTTHSKPIAFLGIFNSIGQAPAYSAVPQYAAGRWGAGADPANVASSVNDAATTRARGEEPLWPVWNQDVRPNPGYGQMFFESLNTESLRAHWGKAITTDVPLIQQGTWNDYTEGSQFQPSVIRGKVALDISTYYLIRWKLGYFPTIRQDALYLTHRNQMANATITGGQTQLMTKRAGSALREHVEVLSFLKAEAQISLKIASNTYTYTAPAGMYVRSFQAAPGEVSVKAVRFDVEIARINSPVVIKSTTENQDRQYAMFGSIRGTAGQFDPTPGSPAPNPANYIA